MSEAPVLAAFTWPTNAELIKDIARLGYLSRDAVTLDPTYGRGVWWKRWRPDNLVTHDITADGVDFRDLPHDDDEFGAVVFDPPYVCIGGRATSTAHEFNERFGLADTPRTPQALADHNADGLAECARVLERKRYLLTKCKDYIWSGKFFDGTGATCDTAKALGLELVDRFEHVGAPGMQPERSRKDGAAVRQLHARRNLSTMFVFRKP